MSWFQLIIAGVLGLIFTQFAFFAHEAAHRQVLQSGKANEWIARIVGTLLVGMSYSWWMNKHSRHHANPNQEGKDPDIASNGVAFTLEVAARQRRPMSFITTRQAYLLIPLLLLEGLNLHIKSVRSLLEPGRIEGRAVELSLIGARFAIYLAVLFWFLPLGMAFAFFGVQVAVFGLYMGASFLPNHTGMAIIPANSKLDFFSKQVSTSRNISGGFWASALLGGLNYQVEHHLFPNMASAAPRQDPRDRARVLPHARRALHGDQPRGRLRGRAALPSIPSVRQRRTRSPATRCSSSAGRSPPNWWCTLVKFRATGSTWVHGAAW